MDENPVQEYESLKSQIDELKVKRLSDLREKERLEAEFEDLKAEILKVYGVKIEDFEKAIEALKVDLETNLKKLKEKIEDCKKQMETQA